MNFTLVKIAVCFIAGILLGSLIEIPFTILSIIGSLLLLLFIFSYIRAIKLFFPDAIFGIVTAILWIFLGVLGITLHSPKNEPRDYSHYTSGNIITAVIAEKLKPINTAERFFISVKKKDTQRATGKILLIIKRNGNSQVQPGELIAFPAYLLADLKPPLNPYTFSYKNYLENLGVYHQISCDYNQLQILKSKDFSIQTIAAKIRNHLLFKLKQQEFSPDEFAVIQALLLGQRQEISSSVYTNYKNAGVIHILAISGLHVGILLLILSWLFKPIEKVKNGVLIKSLLVITFLWIFAIISGLSPSVVRAVTMFSFIALGMQLNRKTNLLNAVFISLLALLALNPKYLFQVGFQLSYAAVLAIATFQPLFLKIYYPANKLLQYFWKLLSVTLAAQIGVLPLSLYYFHQFPGLFFASNLLILPFLGIILGMGILVIVLALLNILPHFLAEAYGLLIHLMNEVVGKVAAQENFVLHKIYMPLLVCIGIYILIFLIYRTLLNRNYKSLILLLIAVIGFQGILIRDKIRRSQNEVVVFQKPATSIIGIKRNDNLTLLEKPLFDTLPGFVEDYFLNFKIDSYSIKPLSNVITIAEKNILIIDSNAVYHLPRFKTDVLIFTNSPKLNLDRLISEIKPQLILADGSNYKSYVNLWRQTCSTKKIPFHSTAEKGAFIIQKSSLTRSLN